MSRSWRARDVRPMVGAPVRFDHVVRHLYHPGESWAQVIPGLGDARGRAWRMGCAPALLDNPNPDSERVSPACRAHVLRDHDDLLMPAYLRELLAAEEAGRFGRLLGDERGWAFVGPCGVFLIVREIGRARTPEVKTAYRVRPGKGRLLEDFLTAAVRKLRDKSSYGGGG